MTVRDTIKDSQLCMKILGVEIAELFMSSATSHPAVRRTLGSTGSPSLTQKYQSATSL